MGLARHRETSVLDAPSHRFQPLYTNKFADSSDKCQCVTLRSGRHLDNFSRVVFEERVVDREWIDYALLRKKKLSI